MRGPATACRVLHGAIVTKSCERSITKLKTKRNETVNTQIASSPIPISMHTMAKTVKTEPMLVHTTSCTASC